MLAQSHGPARLAPGLVNLHLGGASWKEHRRELYAGEEESDEEGAGLGWEVV